jgi:hypothetical protein
VPGGGEWRRGDHRTVVQKRFSALVTGGRTARRVGNSRVTAEHSRRMATAPPLPDQTGVSARYENGSAAVLS